MKQSKDPLASLPQGRSGKVVYGPKLVDGNSTCPDKDKPIDSLSLKALKAFIRYELRKLGLLRKKRCQ